MSSLGRIHLTIQWEKISHFIQCVIKWMNNAGEFSLVIVTIYSDKFNYLSSCQKSSSIKKNIKTEQKNNYSLIHWWLLRAVKRPWTSTGINKLKWDMRSCSKTDKKHTFVVLLCVNGRAQAHAHTQTHLRQKITNTETPTQHTIITPEAADTNTNTHLQGSSLVQSAPEDNF